MLKASINYAYKRKNFWAILIYDSEKNTVF